MLQHRNAHQILPPVDLRPPIAILLGGRLLDDMVYFISGLGRTDRALQFFERFRRIEAGGDLRVVFVEPIGRAGDLRERPAVSAESACDVLKNRSAPFRSRRPLFWNLGRIIGWYLTGEPNPIRLRRQTASASAVSCAGRSSPKCVPANSSRGCPSYLKLSGCADMCLASPFAGRATCGVGCAVNMG